MSNPRYKEIRRILNEAFKIFNAYENIHRHMFYNLRKIVELVDTKKH